jgi:hypothetical protein
MEKLKVDGGVSQPFILANRPTIWNFCAKSFHEEIGDICYLCVIRYSIGRY